MPRAKRPCPAPGCPALTDGGPCDDHRKARQRQVDSRRQSPSRRGYDRRWQGTRLRQLRREPLCRECDRVATDVDHIDGLGPLGPRGHDPANLQSLCHACHSRKTARENGGFGHSA